MVQVTKKKMPPNLVEKTWSEFLSGLFHYKTAKLVNIRSARLGLLHLFITVAILVYIGLWVIYFNKGYQQLDKAIGGTKK